MQFLGLALGVVLGALIGLPIVMEIVALPILAGAVSPPAAFASIPSLGVPVLGAFLLLILTTIVFHVLASFGVTTLSPGAAATTDWREELGRGLLIGQNAALNFMLVAIWVVPGAQILAAFVFVMNAAAVERSISNSPVYQVGLAYTGLFMPMTLPLNVLGFAIGLINTAFAAFGVQFDVFPEWTRAAIVTHGGVFHGVPTAYNLSNFIQAHPAMKRDVPWFAPATPFSAAGGPFFITVDGALRHEGSHTLSAAAFGWIFHLVAFVASWIPTANPDVYGELIAESGLRVSTRSWVEFWAPAVGAPANTPPLVTTAVTIGAGIIDLGGGTTVATRVGTPVPMSATATDADAYPTPPGFRWRASDPTGAPLSLGTGATAVLTPAIGGTFLVDALVTDGADGSGTAFGTAVHVISAVIAPLIPPFPLLTFPRNTRVTIDASASSVGSVAANFAWSVDPTSVPAGANASVTPSAISSIASFVADLPAAYVVTLVLTVSGTDAAGNPASLSPSASTIVTVFP